MAADTSAVRADEQLDLARLSASLGGAGIALEQFPGGHSNLTYLVKIGGRGEFVLRRPPLGPVAPKAHDMVREYRILSAIHPVYPLAPKPEMLCEDVSIIGAPFYLMERRRGLVLRRDNPPERGNNVELGRRVGHAMLDALVKWPGVDVGRPPVSAIGKPAG